MSADAERTYRPLASAAWADADRVAGTYPYRSGSIWLGRLNDGVPVGYLDDRHVCVVSTTRGGKGTTAIVPNLCSWPGSVVVVDPKGENASLTAARRGAGSVNCDGMGQAVRVLDPFEVADVPAAWRGRFNPFDALDPNSELTIDDAARLADAIIVARENAKDPYWDDAARDMIMTLILHVLTSDAYDGRRNLKTVRRLLLEGDREGRELLLDAGHENVASAQLLMWQEVENNPAFGGLVAAFGSDYLDLLKSDPRHYVSVKQSALRNTSFIDSPAMQRCMDASDFKLSDLKADPKGLSLYLCLPQRYLPTHFQWLRMMLALVISEMAVEPGLARNGHDVLVLIDEFAALNRMRFIEKEVAQIAGYHVKLFFVLQTLGQLKATYKDDWETLIGNCGLKFFFGIDDQFSREHISKLIGETEMFRDIRSSGENQSESENESEAKSKSAGRNRSASDSVSGGSSEQRSHSIGGSEGTSWQEHFLGRRPTHGSAGNNWGYNDSYSTNKGWSRQTSEGTNETEGQTKTTGHGTQHGRSTGLSETVQVRPLVSPHEIGLKFSRVKDKGDAAYPGLGLALLEGEGPVAVRRTNYYEDPQFIRCFEPSKEHEFTAPEAAPLAWSDFAPYVESFGPLEARWLFRPGQVVEAGQPLLSVRFSGKSLHVVSPRRGKVEWGADLFTNQPHESTADPGRPFTIDASDSTLLCLCVVWYYAHGAAAVDPFRELAAARKELLARRQKAADDEYWRRFQEAGKIFDAITAARQIRKKWYTLLAGMIAATFAVVALSIYRGGAAGVAVAAVIIGGAASAGLFYKVRQLAESIRRMEKLHADTNPPAEMRPKAEGILPARGLLVNELYRLGLKEPQ